VPARARAGQAFAISTNQLRFAGIFKKPSDGLEPSTPYLPRPTLGLKNRLAIPLSPIPHGSEEWKRLYRGRSAVEREFGRLKHH
jgi:hypothetical protein